MELDIWPIILLGRAPPQNCESKSRRLERLRAFSSIVEGKNLAPVTGACGTRCRWQALNILFDSILDLARTRNQESVLEFQT